MQPIHQRGLLGLIVVGLGVVLGSEAAAHPYLIDVWQTDRGLPHNSVTSILQTRDGYLWFGTFNGLVRFDGVRFKIFDAGNTPGLKSNRILKLYEDRQGRLWIGTETGGLTRYGEGCFQAFGPGEGLADWQVTALEEDQQGAMWVGTAGGGVSRVSEDRFTTFSETSGLASPSVTTVTRDLAGQIWLVAGTTLCRFAEGRWITWPHDERGASLRAEKVFASRDGGLWIVQGDRVRKCRTGAVTEDLVPGLAAGAVVTVVFEDRAGNLWIGTLSHGLSCYPADGSAPVRYSTQDGLSHNWVRCLYEDREGSLWIGTGGGGLNRLKKRTFAMFNSQDDYSRIALLSVCADRDGNLWAGSEGGGLYRLRDGQMTRYGLAEGLANLYVWSVFADRRNTLWAGTWGGGLFRLQEGRFVPAIDSEHAPSIVTAIYEDSQGTLWLGTAAGLGRLRDGQLTLYSTAQGLSHDDVRAIVEDAEGNLWIGTNGGGLNRWREGKFEHFGAAEGLGHDFVWSLHVDGSGVLWIGTFGGGLNRLEAGTFTQCTTLSGLADNVICHIGEDTRGNLWFSSYGGVFRASKGALDDFAHGLLPRIDCVRYDVPDGLGDRQCSGGFQPAGYRAPDGRLWFPNAKGLAVVDPDCLPVNPNPPPVLIEEILVDGLRLAEHDPLPAALAEAAVFTPAAQRTVRIGPTQRRVEFHYTALSLEAPEHVRFKYRLEGLDTDWVYAGPERQASYTTLPPGDYRFRVIACNNSGVWNEAGSAVAITVVPPFWRTPWFVTAMVVLSGGLIACGTRRILRRKMQAKLDHLKEQHAVEKERARIAKDIHDDLGASLTQIALLSELARGDLDDARVADKHLRHISRMARELTRSMGEVVWAINPQNDTLDSLVTYICKFSQEYLGLAGIRCRLDVPTHVPAHPLSTQVRHNLFLALKESLTNIVKHAQATEVWIRLTLEYEAVVLWVEDNGKGFAAGTGAPLPEIAPVSLESHGNGNGHGNGLANLKKRFEEIGGRFELESVPHCGTRSRMVVALKSPAQAD